MPRFLFATTAVLIVAFLFLCIGAWRVYRGRSQPRPLMERAAMAVIFALVGWQALIWLRADQPAASQVRIIVVWVQLLSALGISVVMVAQGWLVHSPSNPK
jgi:hypothetical protein